MHLYPGGLHICAFDFTGSGFFLTLAIPLKSFLVSFGGVFVFTGAFGDILSR